MTDRFHRTSHYRAIRTDMATQLRSVPTETEDRCEYFLLVTKD